MHSVETPYQEVRLEPYDMDRTIESEDAINGFLTEVLLRDGEVVKQASLCNDPPSTLIQTCIHVRRQLQSMWTNHRGRLTLSNKKGNHSHRFPIEASGFVHVSLCNGNI